MISEDFSVVSKLLNVSSLKHRVISHNIANLNTTGYKKKSVSFESMLQENNLKDSILKTNPQINTAQNSDRIDGNSTSLEEEIEELNVNQLRYQTYLQALSYKIKGLQGVISGHFK